MPEELVGRHKRLSFMGTGENVFTRMTKFTSLSENKSPIEYSRQYVDMESETTDVVGYATSVGYSYDAHSDNPVHKALSNIADNELLGTDARVDIVTVDLFESAGSAFKARKRTFAVIPDAIGDGTDALIYSGNFRAVSQIVHGTATSSDGWKTVTFIADSKE